MIALSGFCLVKGFLGVVMLCSGARSAIAYGMALPLCAPIQLLFFSYVAARCAMAWPEITHLRKIEVRSRLAARQGRSAAPLPPAPPAAPAAPVTPVIPRPRRGN
jgi:hypothetical protein